MNKYVRTPCTSSKCMVFSKFFQTPCIQWQYKTKFSDIRDFTRVSSFLINMNFILICLQLLINLNSTSDSIGDYIDNLRSYSDSYSVFDVFDVLVVYITILLLNFQLNKCNNLIPLPECLDLRNKK